jgi:hypothetical protein
MYRMNSAGDDNPADLQRDLRYMTKFMEDLQDCIIRLSDNKRVLESLGTFYKDLVEDMKTTEMAVAWAKLAKCHIDCLSSKLTEISDEINDILRRASVLNTLGRDKGRLVGFQTSKRIERCHDLRPG